ncbi:phage distal tail protein [Amycolatopsis kentuckyensis]|uniref:phage distal tail protein n=1 Tax=Amycolatopsis kentuckyensis TaxID=218823 RepID=UPI000A3B0490|nr:phage tail domain-containing protein [Amycolatopsis kentuckyensis]
MSAEISQWIAVDGTVTTLDVDWDASGRFAPPPVFASTGVPGQPGERLREVRHGIKEFTVKLTLAASDEGSLRTAQRALVKAMNPVRGPGTLRVTSPLGDVREILCYYSDGLGMDEKEGVSGPSMQQADVTFRAFEPYWRDASDISISYTVGVTPTFFPFFPLRLTSSQIAVDATVSNNGDVETWPVWQINGPGNSITLRNITTGELLTLTGVTLTAGQFITVDTRPGYGTVKMNDGTSIFSALTATSSLWSLAEGSNAVRLEMTGATAGASALQLNYRQKYLSP